MGMGRVEGPGGAIGDTLTADLAVFDVARTDCRLIAGNIGGQAVDLQALDTHLAAQVRL